MLQLIASHLMMMMMGAPCVEMWVSSEMFWGTLCRYMCEFFLIVVRSCWFVFNSKLLGWL